MDAGRNCRQLVITPYPGLGKLTPAAPIFLKICSIRANFPSRKSPDKIHTFTPQNLTINTINRYLELKAKQKI
ncbi:MAG: hypothetical protein JWR09_687 [Mucilaginibacter sp.]|nr:hypothetical protein [Mucilaginibacter sp.]